MLYNEIANIQTEALMDIALRKGNTDFKSNILKSSNIDVAYFRNIGIKNPEEYAKLNLLKQVTLGLLGNKYPDLLSMDLKTRIVVIKASKKPLSNLDKIRRKKLLTQFLKITNRQYDVYNHLL